ncbi:hypothetical protein [Ferruginibacter sp.]
MDTEKEYQKAFNNGYVLAQYKPVLLSTICKSFHFKNNYLEGFFAGKELFERERMKSLLFELKKLRDNNDIDDRSR